MVSQQSASMPLNKINKIAPPGPPGLPFVGMLPFLGKHLHLELHQLAKKYGNIYQLHVGSRKLVVLNGLETIKEALVKQGDSFNARADFKVFQQAPQGEFLELKSGEPWKKHRKIAGQVMHTFLSGKSDMHSSWVTDEAADLVNTFLNYDGQPLEPDLYLPLATLSFMQRLLFDKRGYLEKDEDFVATAYGLKKILNGLLTIVKLEIMPEIWQPLFTLSRRKTLEDFPKAMNMLDNYISKNVEQHRESFDPENLKNIADGVLKANSEITESDRNNMQLSEYAIVNGILIQFAAAGTALTSLMLRWALLYLITYPEIQAQIQQELDDVIGREQRPTFADRSKLPFTEACINEIFRHSSATIMPAITYATSTDATLSGYSIPQNTPLFVNYYGLTRDERYWEEPEQFNPYRFLDENGKFRNDLLDKFYPFGVGARRCLGEYLGRLQIFTFFTNLVHQCKFEKAPGEKLSLEPQPGTFLSPEDYRVVVKPRF